MTLNQIDERMAVLVKTERHTTREILELIRYAESVRLAERLGYRNTHHWLIERHKYSGGAADRRIQAARLLKDLPEIAEKIGEGAVNLSTLCKMQTVMRAQQKATGQSPSVEEKREAIGQIENKSCNQAEQVLHTLFPDAEIGAEKTVHKSNGGQRITVELSAEAVRLLERAREILSHVMPGASMGDLIERIAREFVDQNDPVIKAERRAAKKEAQDKDNASHCESLAILQDMRQDKESLSHDGTSKIFRSDTLDDGQATEADDRNVGPMSHCDLAAVLQCEVNHSISQESASSVHKEEITKSRRALPASVRREVIRRAGAQCEYTYENRRCTSRHQLEADHIIPKAKGGSDDFENLRCLCRNHNQLAAELEFGKEFMDGKRNLH